MSVDFRFLNEETLIKFSYLLPFICAYEHMVENREFPKQRFLAFFLSD